jgi:glycosyltransferase involved in cell wall biosynthesis
MKKVIVKGPALTQSGYGEHTRFVLRSLRSQPDLFDIYFININWGQTSWIHEDTEERRWLDHLLGKTIQYVQQGGQFDISLQVTVPNEFEPMAPVNIGVTAGIETTKIAPQWVEKGMNMDKIIVVSEHAKYGFDNTQYPATNNQTGEEFIAKITCPVEVVGYPVKNIKPADIDLNLKYDFNFLTVGTWIVRKNIENTIKWFVEEFYEQEVGLIIKTSIAKNCLRDREAVHNRLKELLKEYDERKCEVCLLHGDMNEAEMTALYQHPKVKAMISASHGEGFGLPLFEAAYNALPIIAPNWGGQVDFLHMPVKDKKGKTKNKSMFSEVAYDIKPIQESAHWEGVIQKDSMWCFPKEWNFKKSMRLLRKSYGSAKAQAKKLQKWIVNNYEESKQYQKMCDNVFRRAGEISKEDQDWNSTLNEIQML